MTSKKLVNINKEGDFLTFGSLDLCLILHLQNEDFINYKISWENLNSLKDLKFLKKNIDLWKRFDLSSNKDTLKLMIQMNKITPNKIKIRYLTFTSAKDLKAIKEFYNMISYVTTESGLYIEACEVCPCDMKLQIKLCFQNKEKVFTLLNEESTLCSEYDNNTSNKSNKERNNPFSYIITEIVNPNNFNYIYFDYSDYTTGDFKDFITIHDLYEYCYHLKTKTSAKIILNLKNEKNNREEFKALLSIIDICIFYSKNDLLGILQKFKYIEDKKLKIEETLKKYYDTKEEPDKNKKKKIDIEEKKNETIKIKNISINKNLNKTEIKSIDNKKATKTISQSPKIIKIKKIKPMSTVLLDKLNMFNYYKKGICDKDPINKNNKKMIIVFDKFNKVLFIKFLKNEDKPSISDFDIKICPKINVHNLPQLYEYKKFISNRYNEYIILFLGCLLSVFASKGKEALDNDSNLYLGYLIGMNYIKKISEIEKNNLPLPADKNFYYCNINKIEEEKLIEKSNKMKKEFSFILDCNSNNKMKQYNPLLDKYLSQFFLNKNNKEYMKSKGFINESGKIIYDPIYKDSLGMSPIYRRKIKINESDENLSNEKLSFNSCGNSPNRKILKLEVNKFIIGHNQKSPNYCIYKEIFNTKKVLPFLKNSHSKKSTHHKNGNFYVRNNKENKSINKKHHIINIKHIFESFTPKK